MIVESCITGDGGLRFFSVIRKSPRVEIIFDKPFKSPTLSSVLAAVYA